MEAGKKHEVDFVRLRHESEKAMRTEIERTDEEYYNYKFSPLKPIFIFQHIDYTM